MVKLLRLTTDKTDASFTCNFNDNIVIPPKSKIALKNLTLTMDEEELKINNSNNLLVSSTNTEFMDNRRSVTLHNADYKYSHYQSLFEELSDFLNSKLKCEDGDNDFNTQIVCKLNENLFFEIIQFKSVLFDLVPTLATQTEDIFIDTSFTGVIQVSQVDNSTITQKHKIAFEDKFIKGAGVFRCRINDYLNNSSGVDDNGFEIGLSDTNPTGWLNNDTMTDDERTFTIKFNRVGSVYVYKDYRGVETNSTVNALSGAAASLDTNDILELKLSEGVIIGNVYSHDGSAYVKHELFRNALYGNLSPGATRPNSLDAFHNLYPYVVLYGDSDDVTIGNIQHSLEESNMENYTQRTNQDEALPNTIYPDIAKPVNVNFNQRFNNQYNKEGLFLFKSREIANYFGFNHKSNKYTSNGYKSDGSFENIVFTASRLFNPAIYSRSFVVELLNIPLTSYDSLYNGRRSILDTIIDGNDITINGHDVVAYEPNNLQFIDIDNIASLNLRNIKIKVLDKNLNEIKIQGLGVITILIQEP